MSRQSWDSFRTEQQVYQVLASQFESNWTPEAISHDLGLSLFAVKQALTALVERGTVRVTKGAGRVRAYKAVPFDQLHTKGVQVVSESVWNGGHPQFQLEHAEDDDTGQDETPIDEDAVIDEPDLDSD